MKICLIIPPSPFLLDERVFVQLGILKIASALEQQNYSVDMVDLSGVENYTDVLTDYVKRKGSASIFGITATTPQVPYAVKIANHLKRSLRSNRILVHDSTDRDQVLEKHKSSNKPTVLLTPSMTEGVDLKDEYSRFQIICKIPYPYLGDKIVKKRMHKWKWWYSLQTAKSIIQSVGRSVRSEKDFAVTYILDEDWLQFYRRNKLLFPKDFHECYKSL